jgi:flavin-dependent dehydrogenase
VAGADGAGSVVTQALGLEEHYDFGTAIQSEVLVTGDEMAKRRGQVTIDLGCIPDGYGWVFPKSNYLSIGLAQRHARSKGLKQHYHEFLKSLAIGQFTITRLSGALVPMYRGEVVVSRARAVLVGDAAGLVDPLTGEGIHNAVFSAILAAPAVKQALEHGEAELVDYQWAVESQIVPEIRAAHSFSSMMVRFPHLVFRVLGRDERLFRGCCYLLRGETRYSAIMQRLGNIGRLYTILAR